MYIGANFINGMYVGGVKSSFGDKFNDEEVLIGSGLDYIPCVIGDIDELYGVLKDKIEERKPETFSDLSECIFGVVHEYFGDYSNIAERMENYPDLDYISDGVEIGKVSNLKGKNSAMCVERAMVSQNLLNFLGIKSFYKSSGILNNGKSEVHSYNLVEYDGKYYVFDATIPTLVDGVINPLIAEIPFEVYEMISNPKSSIGYSIEVSHYNPLRNEDKHIVYDSGRKQVFTYQEIEDVKKM